MNKRPEKDQVSLAGAAHAAAGRSAGGAKGGEKRKKRKRVPIGAIVLLSVVAVIAATAVGIIKTFASIVMFSIVNFTAKRLNGRSLL